MKKLFFLLAVALLPLANKAQSSSNYEDVVYLKNGSIYRGLILEEIPNQTLKIQSSDRNVYVISMNDVEKIMKEELPAGSEKNPKEEKVYRDTKYSGFYMAWGIGGGGSSDAGGFIYEMNAGGKIFLKDNDSKIAVGGDIFAFGGGLTNAFNSGGEFGLNGGGSIAFRQKKGRGNLYLTPYSGVNFNMGKSQYDNSSPYNNTYVTYTKRYFNMSVPFGLKFEYNYRYFFLGTNACVGPDFFGWNGGAGVAGRFMVYAGVKF